MLIISQMITQLLTSTKSTISESNCQQEAEKWPFFKQWFISSLQALNSAEKCAVFHFCLCQRRLCLLTEREFFSYLLMAFFKYCCSHLVSGLMQTSLLLFSLALWEKKSRNWEIRRHIASNFANMSRFCNHRLSRTVKKVILLLDNPILQCRLFFYTPCFVFMLFILTYKSVVHMKQEQEGLKKYLSLIQTHM